MLRWCGVAWDVDPVPIAGGLDDGHLGQILRGDPAGRARQRPGRGDLQIPAAPAEGWNDDSAGRVHRVGAPSLQFDGIAALITVAIKRGLHLRHLGRGASARSTITRTRTGV